jgi:hypothetical protein
MNDQARLWIFGLVFLVLGVVFLARGVKLIGKPFRIIHILSGTMLLIAACTKLYFALTFEDRRAKATARNEMLNLQSREYERTLQEKNEQELQQRMPLLRGGSPEDSENKKDSHNEASQAIGAEAAPQPER